MGQAVISYQHQKPLFLFLTGRNDYSFAKNQLNNLFIYVRNSLKQLVGFQRQHQFHSQTNKNGGSEAKTQTEKSKINESKKAKSKTQRPSRAR